MANEKVTFRHPNSFRANSSTVYNGNYQAIDYNPWVPFDTIEYNPSNNFHRNRYVCPEDGLTMRFVWENIFIDSNSSAILTVFIGKVNENASIIGPTKLTLEVAPYFFNNLGAAQQDSTVGAPPISWINTFTAGESVVIHSLVSKPITLNRGDSVFCGIQSNTNANLDVTPGSFYNIFD